MKKLFLVTGLILVFLGFTSIPGLAQCEGDFDCDGDVDGSDLSVFAADFGRTDCSPCESLWQQNGSDIYYNDGNVGIGTSSPVWELEVANLTAGDGAESAVTADDAGGAIAAYSSTLPDPFAHFGGRVSLFANGETNGLDLRADGVNSDMRFYTDGPWPANERMRITDNGYVGIGTTIPQGGIHVSGNGGNGTALFERSGKILALNPNYGDNNQFAHISTVIGSDMGLKLDVNEQTTMTITSGGNVGIGTTAPHDGKLVVANSATDEAYISFQPGGTASNDFVGIRASESGNNTTKLHFGKEFSTNSAFIDLVTLDGDTGNVGIGTSSPDPRYRLHVIGTNGNFDEAVFAESHAHGGSGVTGVAYGDQQACGIFGKTYHSNGWAGYFWTDVGGGVYIEAPESKRALDVAGKIYQRGYLLHADYVFESDYKLESIEQHAKFMWTNKHLKAISKAKVDEDGREIVEVGAHRKGIVEELEKAHIYIEQLHQRLKSLESKLTMLDERLNTAQ